MNNGSAIDSPEYAGTYWDNDEYRVTFTTIPMYNNSDGETVSMRTIFQDGASFGDGAYYVVMANISEIVYELPLGYDTSSIVNMGGDSYGMFSDLINVQYISLGSNFIAPNVVSTFNMFSNCPVLKTLDLSGLDIRNATSVDRMFYNCRRLAIIHIGENFIINTRNFKDMFKGVNQDGNNVCTIYGSYSTLSTLRESLLTYTITDLGLSDVSTVNPIDKENTRWYLELTSVNAEK